LNRSLRYRSKAASNSSGVILNASSYASSPPPITLFRSENMNARMPSLPHFSSMNSNSAWPRLYGTKRALFALPYPSVSLIFGTMSATAASRTSIRSIGVHCARSISAPPSATQSG
jgi:hypothetical protein